MPCLSRVRASLKKEDLLWLAGLLEGEGSFLRPTPSRPNSPMVALHMNDEDVVCRTANLFKMSCISVLPAGWNPKTSYATHIRGRSAVGLMWQLFPHMGLRRRAQILRAIKNYEPKQNPQDFRTCEKCEAKARRKSLCDKHYKREWRKKQRAC